MKDKDINAGLETLLSILAIWRVNKDPGGRFFGGKAQNSSNYLIPRAGRTLLGHRVAYREFDVRGIKDPLRIVMWFPTGWIGTNNVWRGAAHGAANWWNKRTEFGGAWGAAVTKHYVANAVHIFPARKVIDNLDTYKQTVKILKAAKKEI